MTESKTGDDAVAGVIRRREIEGDGEALVAIFPTRRSGIDFLRENNAWGFVTINQDPDYVGMYVSENVNEVRYVASVKDIVPAEEAPLANPPESYEFFDASKKVVVFEPGSLFELEDPILFGERVPYSLRYTDLERFRTAETTDDLF